jgi:hypothetical protein
MREVDPEVISLDICQYDRVSSSVYLERTRIIASRRRF